jgi:RNA polymerase sigma-70 factor, ECF subfamily
MYVDDLWLVYRCRQGDPDAFAALYQRHVRRVYRTALHLVREPGLAEDITQEAFMTAFAEIANLKSPGALRTWLYRIVVTRATRLLRREGGERRPLSLELLPESCDDHDPAAATVAHDEATELRAAIAALDDDHRLPVLLHYYSDLGIGEIAAVLAIPAGTVKSRLFTARRRLAERLAGTTAGRSALRKELRV